MASISAFFQQLTLADLAVGLFFIGLFGAMTQRNIIKTIISVGIMDVAAVAFFVSTNFTPGARPPVATADVTAVTMADPVPQALMITAIVIGVSVVAMCLAMYLRVMYRYETADWDILIRRLED